MSFFSYYEQLCCEHPSTCLLLHQPLRIHYNMDETVGLLYQLNFTVSGRDFWCYIPLSPPPSSAPFTVRWGRVAGSSPCTVSMSEVHSFQVERSHYSVRPSSCFSQLVTCLSTLFTVSFLMKKGS